MSSKLFVKGKFTMQQFSFNLITIYTLCRMYTHSLIISVLHKLKNSMVGKCGIPNMLCVAEMFYSLLYYGTGRTLIVVTMQVLARRKWSDTHEVGSGPTRGVGWGEVEELLSKSRSNRNEKLFTGAEDRTALTLLDNPVWTASSRTSLDQRLA